MHLYLNRNGNAEGPYPAEQVKMMVGWWGIPWGIFFTIGALWKNATGGIAGDSEYRKASLTDGDVDTAVALEESILKTERRLSSGEKMATYFAPPED